jgi:ribosomal protein S12 methylthiotransferase accessory factor
VYALHDHALYYVPPARAHAFDWLRSGTTAPLPLAELPRSRDCSLQACISLLSAAGVRVAIADLTAPDVAQSPFTVVRALGTNLQPIDFGHACRRLANPRLRALAGGQLNPDPHPMP